MNPNNIKTTVSSLSLTQTNMYLQAEVLRQVILRISSSGYGDVLSHEDLDTLVLASMETILNAHTITSVCLEWAPLKQRLSTLVGDADFLTLQNLTSELRSIQQGMLSRNSLRNVILDSTEDTQNLQGCLFGQESVIEQWRQSQQSYREITDKLKS